MAKAVNLKKSASAGRKKAGAMSDASSKMSDATNKKRVNVQVHEDLHTRFKMACARNQTDMSSVLVDLIEGYCEEHGM